MGVRILELRDRHLRQDKLMFRSKVWGKPTHVGGRESTVIWDEIRHTEQTMSHPDPSQICPMRHMEGTEEKTILDSGEERGDEKPQGSVKNP